MHVTDYAGKRAAAERRIEQLQTEQQYRADMPHTQRKAEGDARRAEALARMEKAAKNNRRRGAGRKGTTPYGNRGLPGEQASHLRQPPPHDRGNPRMGR
ncbi:hypothetical protein ACWDBW_46195 [Streptomyces sp. NPDC001107]